MAKFTASEARDSISKIESRLRDHVKAELRRITELADEYGIVVSFLGLPPFDEYGNSGYYFPVKSDSGEPWVSSDQKNEYYPLEHSDRLEGWLSSDSGC